MLATAATVRRDPPEASTFRETALELAAAITMLDTFAADTVLATP